MDPEEIALTDEQIRQLLAGENPQQSGGQPGGAAFDPGAQNRAALAAATGGQPAQPNYAAIGAAATGKPKGLTRAEIEQQTGKKIISMTNEPSYIDVTDPDQPWTTKKVPNPEKSNVTVTFQGGTSMTLRDLGDQSYGIVKPGDAFKQDASAKPQIVNTDSGDQFIIRVNPDGSITKDVNPNYRDPNASGGANAGSALGWAQLAWQQERAGIEDQFKNRELTLNEAKAKLQEASDRIQLELSKRGQDVTLRGQDITQRGQDIDKRGQDVNFAESISKDATNAATEMLKYTAPVGTGEDLAGIANAFGQMGYGNTNTLPTFQPRTMARPFDPATFGLEIANRALAQISPAAAAQIGRVENNVGDVNTTLPSVFTAPQAAPVAQPVPPAAVQAAPPQAAPPQATYTAPIVPAVGGKVPMTR